MEAATKYTEWGAIAKVKQMQTEYPAVDFERRQDRVSSAIHSREWFDAKVDSAEARQSRRASSSSAAGGGIQNSIRSQQQQQQQPIGSEQFSSSDFIIAEE
jgi:hypothetical protein